jgi:hypothetical protein
MPRTWLSQLSYERYLDRCHSAQSALPADQITVKIIYTTSRVATSGSAYQPLTTRLICQRHPRQRGQSGQSEHSVPRR